MKEVAWAVSKAGQAKLVLIAPNIQIPCPDSILLAQVRDLVGKCRDVGVPVIMGPSRKQLGMAFRTSGTHPRIACMLLVLIIGCSMRVVTLLVQLFPHQYHLEICTECRETDRKMVSVRHIPVHEYSAHGCRGMALVYSHAVALQL